MAFTDGSGSRDGGPGVSRFTGSVPQAGKQPERAPRPTPPSYIQRFDFAEMARQRSLDPDGAIDRAEQQEFVNLFTDLLQENYIGTIRSYNGDKVIYNRELKIKPTTEVQTALTTRSEAAYSINYRLRLYG